METGIWRACMGASEKEGMPLSYCVSFSQALENFIPLEQH